MVRLVHLAVLGDDHEPPCDIYLGLIGLPDNALYSHTLFRKVVPDHSACEDTFREFLLNGAPMAQPETAA